MTPTRAHMDTALRRVPAGISAMAGDLTDDDERAAALDWLEEFYGRACELQRRDLAPSGPEGDETAREVPRVPETLTGAHSAPPPPGPPPPNPGQRIGGRSNR